MTTTPYNLKVKNTFLEVDVDDDTLSSISLDEEETPKRQVTEPVPYTTPLLVDIPQPKLVHSPYGSWYCKRQESTASASSERIEESTASSEHDIKDSTAERLEESTASSENDIKESAASLEHDFQPEREPDFSYYTMGMARQVTEELCWNDWSEKQGYPDVEPFCVSPHFHDKVTEQYTFEPRTNTMAVADLLGCEQTLKDRPTERRTSRKKGCDVDGHDKSDMPRRRNRRESLIDIAARKQQQQQKKQEKHTSRQRKQGATPNTRLSDETRGYAPKSHVAKFCPQCGGECQMDDKFCRFCGSSVPSSLP